jgi:hypothetical protein
MLFSCWGISPVKTGAIRSGAARREIQLFLRAVVVKYLLFVIARLDRAIQ